MRTIYSTLNHFLREFYNFIHSQAFSSYKSFQQKKIYHKNEIIYGTIKKIIQSTVY